MAGGRMGEAGTGRYRVHDLARLAGTTVRNIRAYRERGLLSAPHLAGRTGWYDDAHLARLRLITRLLDRGYSLANIAELLGAWEAGRPVSQVLGIEQVITRQRSAEEPWVGSRAELAALAGLAEADLPVDRLREIGLAEIDGDEVLVQLPGLLRSIGDLVALGLPLPVVLELAQTMVGALGRLARRLVTTVGETRYPATADPVPVQQFEEDTAAMLGIAHEAVTRIFGWSLERQLAGELGRAVERRLHEMQVVG